MPSSANPVPERRRTPVSSGRTYRSGRATRYEHWRQLIHWCLNRIGEDWIYLTLLGSLMGVFSFVVDLSTFKLRGLHLRLFDEAKQIHWVAQYFSWVLFSTVLIVASASLCHFVAPQAAGSGIPEIKTILRGVVLKEYLTCRTLVTKFVGLVLALGSDLPFGKEGPFVHVASMIAQLLSRLVVSFRGIYENESRSSEMLAAACAVGIASTYGAPIGGVLFSIEVTSVFFPLRNYWRGFISTVCSAITFRLLLVWYGQTDTIVAFSVTNFPTDYPFDPKELVFFAFIGIACGFGGAFFVFCHRIFVRYVLQRPIIQQFNRKYFFVYPAVIATAIASLKCPLGYGRFFSGGMTARELVRDLTSNFSFTDLSNLNDTNQTLPFWIDESPHVCITLALLTLNMFWMTFIANTLPVPCGVFIPVFVTGAAFGRMIGELLNMLMPTGVRTGSAVQKLIPGAYALVGATAFAGAVTHAISTSVIVVEMTGQIIYILPLTLAALLANAIATNLQPSIYDSIIQQKKLPYLPRILPTSSSIHKVYVKDVMVKDVKHLTLNTTYQELQDLLVAKPKLKSFPLVDRPCSRILLGSVRRNRLERLLATYVAQHVKSSQITGNHQLGRRLEALSNERRNLTDELPIEEDDEDRVDLKSEADVTLGSVTPRSDWWESLAEVQTSPSRTTPIGGGRRPGSNATSDRRRRSFLSVVGDYVQGLPRKLKLSIGGNEVVAKLDVSHGVLLDQCIEYEKLQIDSAPFQLVEQTSFYKVYSLFWLLGLNRAYVTSLGRLVGVVALREVREALEKAQTHDRGKKIAGRQHKTDISDAPVDLSVHFRRIVSNTTSSGLVPTQSEVVRLCVEGSSPVTPSSVRRFNRRDRPEESLVCPVKPDMLNEVSAGGGKSCDDADAEQKTDEVSTLL